MHSRFLNALVAVALVLVVACGADDAPAGTPPPAETPTTTRPPTAAPFIAATTETFRGISQGEFILLGLGPKREFPVALLSSSERLPSDEVSRLWTEYLGDARIVGGKGISLWDLCARESLDVDGASDTELWRVGRIVKGGTSGGIVGEGVEIGWKVEHSPAQRWNLATLDAKPSAGGAGTSFLVELIPPSDATGLPEIFETSGGTSGGEAVHEITAKADSICHP